MPSGRLLWPLPQIPNSVARENEAAVSSRYLSGKERQNRPRKTGAYDRTICRCQCERGKHPMGKLTGKIAVVTGGSAGIGQGIAARFVAEGAQVFITGR